MIALWVGVAWAGSTWFVPDEQRATELRSALAAGWPADEPVVVVVGLPGDGRSGIRWSDGVLVRRDPGEMRTAQAPDANGAVRLARAWLAGATSVAPPPATIRLEGKP